MPDSCKGRIAIFYPWGNLGAFPSLRDAITLLVEQGYEVDFYTEYDAAFPSSDINTHRLSIINRPEAFLIFVHIYPQWVLQLRFTKPNYRWLMMKVFRPMLRKFFFNDFLRQRHIAHPYVCMIGMDPGGLASVAPLAKMLNLPLVYWSLELLFAIEITTQNLKSIKSQEIRASRQANFTIVQDRWRGQALIEENGLEPSRVLYVPNAPRGKARREKSDYLHQRLNISLGRKIILYTGRIAPWSLGMDIIATAADWPDDWVLVIQSSGRRMGGPGEKYWDKLVKLVDPQKVMFSFEPVPQSEYRGFVDSANIGLAFYTLLPSNNSNSTGKNIYLMGLSSGKIAAYLYSGLPVIVNDATIGPKELVQSSNCGICVSRPEEIKDALETIFNRYDWYVANACRCFDQNLELEKHFMPVIQRLNDFD